MAALTTLPVASTRVDDGFWTEWQRHMAQTGIPHQWRMCEQTGRIENLRRCARKQTGDFQGLRFNDSDVYKLLEATSYAIALGMGGGLEEAAGEAVDLIAAAQMSDGYINTFIQLAQPEMRWKSLNAMHEMYCMGHLIEAAVAHHHATGSARLLEVAKMCASHVMERFPSTGRPVYPDHQEVEMALVRLAETTGDEKYRDYAKWQTLSRGSRPSPFEAEFEDPEVVALTPGVKPLYVKEGVYDGAYAQDDVPLVLQTRAVGHAVRAVYFYCGAVDSSCEDTAVMSALETIWDGLVTRQMYVTGGIGSSGRNEGFTNDFDLPNLDAYAETCAGIGLVFWAWRMFCALGDGKYIDVLERALYNAVLSGVSPSCDRYFYDNPLESDGRHERQPWFSCACCPPNIARIVMSIGRYAVAHDDRSLYVAVPIGGSYKTPTANVEIKGNYPWFGDYEVRLSATDGLKRLALHIPEWADEFGVSVNGSHVEFERANGFAVVERDWLKGDTVSVMCPAEPKWVKAHSEVLACAGRAALQCGPLVYCASESVAGVRPHHFSADLSKPVARSGRSLIVSGTLDEVCGDRLYEFSEETRSTPCEASFQAYHSWADSGPTHMQVWVRTC